MTLVLEKKTIVNADSVTYNRIADNNDFTVNNSYQPCW